LARSNKVSTQELDDALSDQSPSINKEKDAQDAKSRQEAEKIAREKKQDAANKAAEKEMNIHF